MRSLAPTPDAGLGVGDDAALLPAPPGADLVVSTDRVPTDLLALRFGLMGPRELGAYLAEVNVSDLVAMRAHPAGLLLNIGVPSDFLVADFRSLLEGFVEAGRAHGAPLIGGDTSYAAVPSFSATALGWVAHGEELRRDGVRPGDTIAVTGALGGFGAALVYFSARREGRVERLAPKTEGELLDALVRPKARSDLLDGLLRAPNVSAAMDITDGLGQTLVEFAEAGGAGIDLLPDQIPVQRCAIEVSQLTGVPLLEIVFGIGLELQLLLSLSPQQKAPLHAENVIAIGEVSGSHESVRLIDSEGRLAELPGKQWQHFRDDPEDLIAGA